MMVQGITTFCLSNGPQGLKYLVSLPLHFQQVVLCLQSILLVGYGTVASVLEDA